MRDEIGWLCAAGMMGVIKIFMKVSAALLVTHTTPVSVSRSPSPKPHTLTPASTTHYPP